MPLNLMRSFPHRQKNSINTFVTIVGIGTTVRVRSKKRSLLIVREELEHQLYGLVGL